MKGDSENVEVEVRYHGNENLHCRNWGWRDERTSWD